MSSLEMPSWYKYCGGEKILSGGLKEQILHGCPDSPPKKRAVLGASPGPLGSMGTSGVGQSYSVGGSSDAACRCQYCSK